MPPPEKKEGDPDPQPGGFDIKIFRLAAPMQTKTSKQVTKTTMEFLLKLKMDGFHVGRIHSDRGHEFSGPFRKWALDRGIMLTRTPGDDPRANGRVEVAVKSFKTHIRRLLKQAEVGSEMWPLAARYADALNRSWRIGDAPAFPPFLQEILVRRRTWRRGVFEPTVEKVKYLFPVPEEHGHWVQPADERPRVTKYVMRKATEPITNQKWVAIEKEVADALTTRRRLREKTTVRKMEFGEKKTEESQKEDEEKFQKLKLRLSRIIEEEMKLMVEDHPELAKDELAWIAKMKKMMEEPTEEDEILQTKGDFIKGGCPTLERMAVCHQRRSSKSVGRKAGDEKGHKERIGGATKESFSRRSKRGDHPVKTGLHCESWPKWREEKDPMGYLRKL